MIFKYIPPGISGVPTGRLGHDSSEAHYIWLQSNGVAYVSGNTVNELGGSSSLPPDGSVTLAKFGTITGDMIAISNEAGVIQERTVDQMVAMISGYSLANNLLLINSSNVNGEPDYVPKFVTLSSILDEATSPVHGAILYRNGAQWTYLAPGTSGNVLCTGGNGINPSWIAPSSIYQQYMALQSGRQHAMNTEQIKFMPSGAITFTNTDSNTYLTELDMNTEPNALYEIKYNIIASSSLATAGIMFKLNVTNASKMHGYLIHAQSGVGSTTSKTTYIFNANNTEVAPTNAPYNFAGTVGMEVVYAIFSTNEDPGYATLGRGLDAAGTGTIYGLSNVRLRRLG